MNQTEDLFALRIESQTVVLQQADPSASPDRAQLLMHRGVVGEVDFGRVVNDKNSIRRRRHPCPGSVAVSALQILQG